LAAALEYRFQIAVFVCGTKIYAYWRRITGCLFVNKSIADQYVRNVLMYMDWPEVLEKFYKMY